jgi:O-6-methylguanine DNA methyltransferase
MTQQTLSCLPLRQLDAGLLRQASLRLDGSGTLAGLRQAILTLQTVCARSVWLIAATNLAEAADATSAVSLPATARPLAVLGLQTVDDSARRVRVHLFCGPQGLTGPILAELTDQAMNRQNSYRLELEIRPEQASWPAVLQAQGWQEEGRLQRAAYDTKRRRHEDIRLFVLHRPLQQRVGVAFIPFGKGVLAIAADTDGLLDSYLAHHGQKLAPERLQEAAEWLDLLDEEGFLLEPEVILRRISEQPWLVTPAAPPLLEEAAKQAADYFQGKRNTFDLPLHLEQGSPFQQLVWQALQTIPFGQIRTYQEIAQIVGGADRQIARRMARAVGAACGANPLPLIIPCHRVIGKDGRLVGFSGGLDFKEYLLAHEIMGLT